MVNDRSGEPRGGVDSKMPARLGKAKFRPTGADNRASPIGKSPLAGESRRRMDELSFTERSLRETLVANRDKLTVFGRVFGDRMCETGLAIIQRQQVELLIAERGQIRGVA